MGPRPVTIFSLTDQGVQIADKIRLLLPQCEHLHRPEEFVQTARQAFASGSDCVFICATGIVIRALAPMLKDKYQDPAVVALDQQGKFVIPLLAGHQGGAGELGFRIANILGAQLVATSISDYSQPVYCIGAGSDRDCPPEQLRALYDQAIETLNQPLEPACIASIVLKQEEPAMLVLADSLDVPFRCYEAQQLRTVEHLLSRKSESVFRATGCYGVAEAAALIAASELTGNPAELVLAKIKNSRSTISVARSYR